MNCLEAQSKIIPFIEDKLDNGDEMEFIRHVKSCDNCQEELEIYYTMIVGMKQLDQDILSTKSFREQMEDKLNADYRHISNNRKITGSTVVLLIFVLCGVVGLGYKSHMDLLYEQEQLAIKEQQSPSHYADYYGEYLFTPEGKELFDFVEYTQIEKKENPYRDLKVWISQHADMEKMR